ncbi:MAG: hypothetical protein HUU43_00755 [Ignavibacteriaceae bacterium]|nr:hypothetical protein [Ignavibacteriaceae bacterium]NUM69348.1 hypothetical protein [Ignavibacteriaceae bacterium]
MKTKLFIIFLFILLAGSLYSQNQYERWNGVFEGGSGNYSFIFDVYQQTIGINGEKSSPIFTVHRLQRGKKITLTRDVSARDISPEKDFTLYTTGMNRTGGKPLLNASFKQGAAPKDDTYEISKYFGFPSGEEDFSTIVLKRVK